MKRLQFFLLWGAVFGILIPGVGVLIALVMAICAGSGDATVLADEGETAVQLPVAVRAQPHMERIVGALDFVPLVEVFSGTDIDLKRGAIEQLVRLRTPEAIGILLDHRSDSSLEVRYYVNAALARVKNQFDEELDAARQQMRLETYKSSDRIFLAKTYLQYARSGLLDEELARNYEHEAIFHLTFVLDSESPPPDAYRTLIACYMAHEGWTQAGAVVDRARETQALSASEIDQYQVMIDYHSGRYFKIPALMRSMRDNNELSSEWKSAALWWGGSA